MPQSVDGGAAHFTRPSNVQVRSVHREPATEQYMENEAGLSTRQT